MRREFNGAIKLLVNCRLNSTIPPTQSKLKQSKLIVLSNRLPFVIKEEGGQYVRKPRSTKSSNQLINTPNSAGGLVTAVAPVVISGNGLWIGWPGPGYSPPRPIPESHPKDVTPTAGLKSNKILPVLLESHDVDLFYDGFCNNTVWPLFHSMPARAQFSRTFWDAYKRVNEQFGIKATEAIDKISEEERLDTIVWIHDYQLMIAANSLRENFDHPTFKIGFFLHIPFPCWDLYRTIPWADLILQGMLGCDMVGFHTALYCFNFINCCRLILGCNVDYEKMLVEHGGRTIQVAKLPVGLPYDSFVKMAQKARRIFTDNKQILLGVDRLDYTKGIPNRISAIELFFHKYPEFIEKVQYLQIAVPSRTNVPTYQRLKTELDQLVGDVNGRLTTTNWSPIRYIYGMRSQEELSAIYRDSDVALVTPLRDGMNLVAKEYVACQTGPPGVLVLSPFAGAAETMKEALLCSPYDKAGSADTIFRALTMSETEKEIRMRLLRHREEERNIHHWMGTFLHVMDRVAIKTEAEVKDDKKKYAHIEPLTEKTLDDLSRSWKLKPNVAILMDYDGSIAPITMKRGDAQTPVQTRNLLQRLSEMPNVTLGVISGRLLEDVMKRVGVKNVIFSGSHGKNILYPDGEQYEEKLDDAIVAQSEKLFQELEKYINEKGAWVEKKGIIQAIHFLEVPYEKKLIIIKKAVEIISKHGFVAKLSSHGLEVTPNVGWNKGTAVLHILKKKFSVDLYQKVSIFYVGDEITDEDVFQVLKGYGHTFRVAKEEVFRTHADRRLPSLECIIILLTWLEKRYSELLKQK